MGRFIITGVGDISVQQSQVRLFLFLSYSFLLGKGTVHPLRCGNMFVFIYVFIYDTV